MAPKFWRCIPNAEIGSLRAASLGASQRRLVAKRRVAQKCLAMEKVRGLLGFLRGTIIAAGPSILLREMLV
jgi:hypothetical protein